MGLFGSRRAAVLGRPQALVSDTFTRGDSASSLGTAETGQAWTALGGTFGISGNQGYYVGGGGNMFAVVDAGLSDCTIDCDLTLQTLQYAGLGLRASDNSNGWVVYVNGGDGNIQLIEVAAGIYTSRVTYSSAPVSAPSRTNFRVILAGASIKVLVRGTQIISYASASSNQTVTKHGLWSGGATSMRWDNFRVWR